MAINISDAMLKHQKSEQLRLQKYMEQVKSKLTTTVGEMREFWKREEKRTQRSLEKFA